MGQAPDGTVYVTVNFKMNKRTAELFLQSALERVVNTSIRMIEDHCDKDDDQYINLEDWSEWKPVVCTIWTVLHDAVFCEMANMEYSGRIFELKKGD